MLREGRAHSLRAYAPQKWCVVEQVQKKGPRTEGGGTVPGLWGGGGESNEESLHETGLITVLSSTTFHFPS